MQNKCSVLFFIFIFLYNLVVVVTSEGSALFNSEEYVYIDENRQEPVPPIITDGWTRDSATIFIGINRITSGEKCADMIKKFFDRAQHPERIYFGLVEEHPVEEASCIPQYCRLANKNADGSCMYKKNLLSIAVSAYESKGKYYTRHLFMDMLGSQEFCMNADEHIEISPRYPTWDMELIDTWMQTRNEYAVLSTKLLSHGIENSSPTTVPHLCQASINSDGNVVSQLPRDAVNLNRPLLSPMYSGDFSFSKCHAEKKVPQDPHIFFLNDELNYVKFAKLWTRGYDVYSPHKKIFHKNTQSVAFNHNDNKQYKGSPILIMDSILSSYKRIALLLGSPEMSFSAESVASLTRYGLGMKRRLDALIEFTGIDTRNKVIFENRCADLHWVPFIPDKNPRFDTTDVWGNAPEIIGAGAGIPLLSGRKIVIFPEDELLAQNISVNSEVDGASSAGVGGQTKYTGQSSSKGRITQLTGELWWVFQWVDVGVERMIESVDGELARSGLADQESAGYLAVQVFLIVGPILLFVYFVAVSALHTGGVADAVYDDPKRRM